jgi:hypothetical protein
MQSQLVTIYYGNKQNLSDWFLFHCFSTNQRARTKLIPGIHVIGDKIKSSTVDDLNCFDNGANFGKAINNFSPFRRRR